MNKFILLGLLARLTALDAHAGPDTPYSHFAIPTLPTEATTKAGLAGRTPAAVAKAWKRGAELARSGETFFYEIRTGSGQSSRLASFLGDEKRACFEYGTPQAPTDAVLLHWCQTAYEAMGKTIAETIMAREGDSDICTLSFAQGMTMYRSHHANCEEREPKFAFDTPQIGCFTLGYQDAQSHDNDREAPEGSVPSAASIAQASTPIDQARNGDTLGAPAVDAVGKGQVDRVSGGT